MTFGRSLKSLLIMDDGAVVGCGITTKTIHARLETDTASRLEGVHSIIDDDSNEEDIEHEDECLDSQHE